MTEDESAPVRGEPAGSEAERAARLAALLSVDISDRRVEELPPDDVEVESEQDTEVELPAPAVRSDRGAPGSRWRAVVGAATLIALLVSGVGLAYAGTRIVRSSTEGEVVEPVDDPTAPGFEALVEPTPTMLVLHEAEGAIDALTVLTLPDPDQGGGGVLLVPVRTVTEVPYYDLAPIEVAYRPGDPAFQIDVVGDLLGTGMRESVVVDDERWADLVAPVAPLTIDNPNELVIDGEVAFPLGEIELTADAVGPYLEAQVDGESDLARLFRHELVWRAWLEAVAEAGTDAAVPGELETGIARFVRTLARGEPLVQTLPVQPAAAGRYGDEPAFVPRFAEMEVLVGRLVPFPVSPRPGVRARLRVLNGTPDTTAAAEVASALPPAGVEVVLVGNAASLDVAETTVTYVGDDFRDEAEAVTEILGVGRVVEETRPSDVADITVTLGEDYG